MSARRTQADRREGTVRKLLDAATEALIEVGYAGASVQEICGRAGVSHGGLFRHFKTREALMVAATDDVGKSLLAAYRRQFLALRDQEEPLRLALRLVRKTTRSPLNQAWYELANAARTNPRLKKALAPLGRRYYEDIAQLGREILPEVAELLGAQFDLFVTTVVAVFDGEQVQRSLLGKADAAEQRLELLMALIGPLLQRPATAGAPRGKERRR